MATLGVSLMGWQILCMGQFAKAEVAPAIVSIAVHNQVVDRALIVRAEALVEREIQRQFDQSAELSSVEVMVLGDSNGEVAPILTTTVSRAQWAENPRVASWSTYYDSAYQLFQRHEDTRDGIIAGIPVRATVARAGAGDRAQRAFSSRKPSGPRLAPWQVDEAYDSGRLTGEEIQREYLDYLD